MRTLITIIALAALTGCSTAHSNATFNPRPISIGASPNALKRAPCAGGCGEVRQKPGMPAFLTAPATRPA